MNPQRRPLRPGVVVSVAGISHNQDIARAAQIGDEVALTHDVSNPFDSFAVTITTADGDLLGFVPRAGDLNQRLVVGHEGGIWTGIIVDKYDAETVGLRVQINALVGTRNAAFGSDLAGVRTRDVDALVDQMAPMSDVASATARADAQTSEPVSEVWSRSGRKLGTFVGKDGSKTRVRTPDGRTVAYPTGVVEVRSLQKTA